MMFTTRSSRPAAGVLLTLGALCSFPSVQAANAACGSGWEWSYNSKGQNPCEVAASLQGPCLGQPMFEVRPLDPGNHYINPKKEAPLRKRCGCNTVLFGLYTACTLCQNSNSTYTWKGWSQFCDNVYVAQYPFDIPKTTTVPHWAYIDYTKEDKFDPTSAKAVGRDPETTPPATSSATNPPPTVTDPSNEGGDQGDNNGRSTTNVGAIAGGVVGGVVGLMAIAALIFFFRRRNMPKEQRTHVIDLDLATEEQWGTVGMEQAHKPPRLYDPSDPSTFPAPVPVTGESYTPIPDYTTPAHNGKYTGTAEI